MIKDKGLRQPKLRNAAVLENLQSLFQSTIHLSIIFFHEPERGL